MPRGALRLPLQMPRPASTLQQVPVTWGSHSLDVLQQGAVGGPARHWVWEMRGGCCKETHADREEEYDCRKAGKSRADLSAVRELTMGMIADCLGKHRSTRYSH